MEQWTWGSPLIEGYSNSPQKGYSEADISGGSIDRKLNFTDIYDVVSCNFSLTKADYISFMAWYRDDLRQGTLPFEIMDCRYGTKRVARLIDDVPDYATNSNRFDLSLKMAFMPGIILHNFCLIVNESDHLIVNDNDHLVVGQALRV